MFAKTRRRLTLLLVAIFMFLYIAATGSIYLLMVRLTVSDENALLLSSAKPLSSEVFTALNTGRFPQEFVDLKKLAHLYPRLTDIILRDALGNVLADTNPALSDLLPHSDKAEFHTLYVSNSKMWIRLLTVHFSNQYGQSDGYLQLAFNVTKDVESLARLRQVMVMVGIGGAVLALLAAFFASDRMLQPIAKSWRRQQQFVGDASHELRTPLAVIQANLDVVLQHTDESVLDNLEWISAARSEVGRLTKLTADLLTLARVDSNQALINKAPVDLQVVAEDVVNTMSLLAEAKGITVDFHGTVGHDEDASSSLVTGDRDRLHQLVAILVDNAIKYTSEGGRVSLSFTRRRGQVQLDVEDTGIGIARSDIGRVFERFYRGDAARTRSSGGTGLGLSIAEWIVEAHGGRISVRSAVGQGTTFTVVLPSVAQTEDGAL